MLVWRFNPQEERQTTRVGFVDPWSDEILAGEVKTWEFHDSGALTVRLAGMYGGLDDVLEVPLVRGRVVFVRLAKLDGDLAIDWVQVLGDFAEVSQEPPAIESGAPFPWQHYLELEDVARVAERDTTVNGFYESGAPAFEIPLKADKASGKVRAWYPTGVLKYEALYADGRPAGTMIWYAGDGTPIDSEVWLGGVRIDCVP